MLGSDLWLIALSWCVISKVRHCDRTTSDLDTRHTVWYLHYVGQVASGLHVCMSVCWLLCAVMLTRVVVLMFYLRVARAAHCGGTMR